MFDKFRPVVGNGLENFDDASFTCGDAGLFRHCVNHGVRLMTALPC
jgi:hypothetical protein